MNPDRTRRQFLRLIAGTPLLAAGGDFASAAKVEGANAARRSCTVNADISI